MGIDYKSNRFTPANHEMLPVQTEVLIRDTEPGQIVYIDLMDYWIDVERKAWVNGNASTYDATEIPNFGGSQDFGRLIGTHDGLILDLSHFDVTDWLSGSKVRRQIDAHDDDVERISEAIMKIPIVHVITNYAELEIAEKILANYNITLEGTELEQVNNEYAMTGEEDEPPDEEAEGIS